MSAEPLVLVPGLLCDEAVWAPQIRALQARFPVQVPHHGERDSLGAMAEAILAQAAPRFALAGHSMGGRVALEVYARAPERVTRLALLDTGYEGFADGAAGERDGRLRLLGIARSQGMRPMGADWARGMVHPARLTDTALMEAILDMIARANPAVFAAQIRALLARPDRTALLPRIAVPTLVLCGHEDSWSPIERHRVMAAQIPHSVLVDIPDSGHMCTMERPEEVSQALRAWLTDAPQIHAAPKEP
jgi:pimeloyl-ACP methyl ester carboxylesterase